MDEMPTCYVLVGLPGVGKSTMRDRFVGPNIHVFSTDDFMDMKAKEENTTYDEAYNKYLWTAEKECKKEIPDAFGRGDDIVWDQTNMSSGKRVKIIAWMKSHKYRVECLCILNPETEAEIGEWNRRLDSRPGKNISQEVIDSMLEKYELPTMEEGFDQIRFFDMNLNEVEM